MVYKVTDNGAGMDAAVSDVLLKEFITTKGTRGTGFGLMTTKKIVDEYGGRMTFNTQKGEGSCFCIHLPVNSKVQVTQG